MNCLDKKRAKDTWQIVKRLQQEGEADPKKQQRNREYASYVKGLPATVLMCGLGQAVATLQARSRGNREDAHWLLHDHLKGWLCRSDSAAPYGGSSDLMDAITQGDRDSYISAQEETLRWLEWLKKFAVAYLSGLLEPAPGKSSKKGGAAHENPSL